MEQRFNIYEFINNKVIEQLKNGMTNWKSGLLPSKFNRVSKKQYSCINSLILPFEGEYASFKQWKKAGGFVRKGEHGFPIVWWNVWKKPTINDKGEPDIEKIPLLRYYTVFHISQVEGVEPLKKSTLNSDKNAEKIAADYISKEGIKFQDSDCTGGWYSPSRDIVNVPPLKNYKESSYYYEALFHELAHSTMLPGRCNRKNGMGGVFGSHDYSFEELVAELASAVMLSKMGLAVNYENSASYLAGWVSNIIRDIEKDKMWIIKAAGKADKAAKYIMGDVPDDSDVDEFIALGGDLLEGEAGN